MQTLQRIGIGILIGLSFATGYAVRVNHIAHEQQVISRTMPAYDQGTRIAAAGLEGGANVDFRPIQTLYTVLADLREHYVEQLTDKNQGEMTSDAIRAMLSSLDDPDTKFVSADEKKIIVDARNGKYHGIGAMLAIKRFKSNGVTEERLVVVSPIADGPAAKAKLETGDVITSVDGQVLLPFDPFGRVTKILKDGRSANTARSILRKQLEAEEKRMKNGIGLLEAIKTLNGKDNKSIELSVLHKGSGKENKLKLDAAAFTVDPVSSKLLDGQDVGYVKINCLSADTGEQFGKAISDLKSKNAKSMVLDLRDLSGGDTDSVLQVAKYLSPDKSFAVLLRSRNRKSTLHIPNAPSSDVWQGPLVVLVNNGTARTPEVLAAALRDNISAKLVGENTHGDSVYTTLYNQRDGSAVLLTTGKFLTSKNRDYTGKGISVDEQVASGLPGDAQLKEAVKLASAGNRS